MLNESDWEALSGVPVFWPDVEDAMLDAIFTIETIWAARHRGHAWRLDRHGEGPSRLTFADLGLKLALQSALSAVCPLHGRFDLTLPSLLDEHPRKIACPGRRRARCGRSCTVDSARESLA